MAKKKEKFTNPRWVGVEFKSKEELYFSFYCDELLDAGFLESAEYEVTTFLLSGPQKFNYTKQLLTKTKTEEAHLLHKASCTADFTLSWNISANNLFVYDLARNGIVRDIKIVPFRSTGEFSYVEVKAEHEGNTSSSIAFPYKQKWVWALHGSYIQKIVPFGVKKKDVLMRTTFCPKLVQEREVYKVNCKSGKIGESKLKYPVLSLEEYLKTRGYGV